MKVLGQNNQFLQSYKGSKNKLLTGARKERESRKKRDYRRDLTEISSAGQVLCNSSQLYC